MWFPPTSIPWRDSVQILNIRTLFQIYELFGIIHANVWNRAWVTWRNAKWKCKWWNSIQLVVRCLYFANINLHQIFSAFIYTYPRTVVVFFYLTLYTAKKKGSLWEFDEMFYDSYQLIKITSKLDIGVLLRFSNEVNANNKMRFSV